MPNNFEELLLCQKDFVYFVENYIKILNPKKGLIPFNLYQYQKDLATIYDNNKNVAVIKFRQGGFTTFTILYHFWECMFQNNKNFLCISGTLGQAAEVGKLINSFINNMPDWLQPKMDKNTGINKVFSTTNSSMCFGISEFARGRSVTNLVIDEAAFIPDMKEKWKSIYQCVNSDSKIHIISTVNGPCWFDDLCEDAFQKRNNFFLYHANYKDNPEHTEEWARETRKILGEKSFAQEVLGENMTDYAKLSNKELTYELKNIYLKNKNDKETLQEAINRLSKMR